MVNSNRSGRIQNDFEVKGKSRTKIPGENFKGLAQPDSAKSMKSTKRKVDDGPMNVQSSAQPGSIVTVSHGLRSRIEEQPSLKKIKTSNPTILRKSERFQKQTLNGTSDNRKSETLKCKHSASPLRRSERIGKPVASGYPSSTNSRKNSSSTEAEKRKNVKAGAKLSTARKSEQSNESGPTIKNEEVLKKKKRLDARSYRASFSSTRKKSQVSESGRVLQKGDSALQRSIQKSKAESSGESQVGDEDYGLKVQKSIKENSADVKGITEREVVNLILVDKEGRNRADSNGSNKFCVNDANESENADMLDLKWKNSIQSTPVGTTTRYSVSCASGPVAEAIESEGCSVTREQTGILETNDSPSESRLHADDVDGKGKAEVGFPLHAKMAVDVDSDISATQQKNCRQGDSSAETSNCIVIAEECHSLANLEESSQASMVEKDSESCVICKHPGLLVSCDGSGCRRSYHLACMDPPPQVVPFSSWLCLSCIKKKLIEGVYSVSDEIEYIMSVKEGTHFGREYLVKYEGLAHVHNRWVPESQILKQAPALVADFNDIQQNEKAIRWNQEWMEPQRLLQKRLVMPTNLAEEFFSQHGCNLPRCYNEWLVKWKGLGYEQASWELESSPFLCSFEGSLLVNDYEERRCRAKQASDPCIASKAMHVRSTPFHKLSKLTDGFLSGLDNDHLNSVNRLREFWHKSQAAVLLDGEEKIVKTILLILSLKSSTFRPFLVISKPSFLSLWEAEFSRLAPSVHLVVYNGTKDTRKMIQALEFYEEGGYVMFEVILTHPDAVVEDADAIDCIGWESVIVDECLDWGVPNHLEFFRNIPADFRMLLLSSRLKDNLADYLGVLSFLESGVKELHSSRLECDSNDNVDMLAIVKDKFARHVAYERKIDSPCFLEFWVPADLSNVQLEQYCSILISNSHSLRSFSKVDHVGALRDIVINTRKCCDHPFLVDSSLQISLTNGIPSEESLDVHVKASGKLQLLDKILQEMNVQGLRVVILLQSCGGAGRNQMNDLLEDLLCLRFGRDAYERVDIGLLASKKKAALNRFNDKKKGAFVFLIESRACLPSIKLSSVDAVIIYDSDWNPLNDLKSLQKISMDSPLHQIKVFRLYSAFTVEEGVLALAKKDVILESKLQTISPSVSHSLLSWGASYVFEKLDEFHRTNDFGITFSSKASSKVAVMDEVVSELLKQLQSNHKATDTTDCSILIKVIHSGNSYSRNICLVGEKKGISSMDVDVANFWTTLLENRCPQWRYVSDPLQKPRRKLPCSNELVKVPEDENQEVKKKCKKVAEGTALPASLQSSLPDESKDIDGIEDAKIPENPACSGVFNRSPLSPGRKPFAPSLTSTGLESPRSVGSQTSQKSSGSMSDRRWHPPSHNLTEKHFLSSDEVEGTEELLPTQRKLHLLLKPELAELCGALGLPDAVKGLAEKFLEYVMNNHHVNVEPKAILEALKISLCWRAAAFCKHKVNHRQTLEIAKSSLNFGCSEEQAESVYSKLKEQILKKMFHRQTSMLNRDDEKNSEENFDCKLHNGKIAVPMTDRLQAEAPVQELEGEIYHQEMIQEKQNEAIRRHLAGRVQTICLRPNSEENSLDDGKENKGHQPASVEELEEGEIRSEKMNQGNENGAVTRNLVEKVLAACSGREKDVLLKQEQEKAEFNRQREEEKTKLQKKLSKEDFSKILDPFDKHMILQRIKLITVHVAARNKERQLKDSWLKEAEAGIVAESFCDIPLPDSGFMLEKFEVGELGGLCTSEEAVACSQPGDQQSRRLMTTEQISPDHTSGEPAEISNEIPSVAMDILFQVDNSSPSQPNCTSLEISCEQNNTQSLGDVVRSVEECVPMEEDIRASDLGLPEDVNMMSEGSGNRFSSANVETESHDRHADDAETPCVIAVPVENQIEIPHLPAVTSSFGRETSPPPNQVPLVISSEQSPSQASHTVGPSSGARETTNQLHVPTATDVILAHQGNMVAHVDTSQVPFRQLHDVPSHPPIETLWISPEGIHPDPLENELIRIRRQEEHIRKIHEEKKLQIHAEFEQEVEKIRNKYAGLIQNADAAFSTEREKLADIYSKVLINRVLAEEFRLRFIDYKASAPQGQWSTLQQYMQMRQPQYASKAPSPVHASRISNHAPVQLSGPANLPRLDTIPTIPPACPNASIASTSASPAPMHLQAAAVPVSSNVVTVRPLASPIPPGSNNSASNDSNARCPAPHLSYRPPRISPMVLTQQEQNVSRSAQPEPPPYAPLTVTVTSATTNNLVSDVGVPSSEANGPAMDVICIGDD